MAPNIDARGRELRTSVLRLTQQTRRDDRERRRVLEGFLERAAFIARFAPELEATGLTLPELAWDDEPLRAYYGGVVRTCLDVDERGALHVRINPMRGN